MDKVRAYTNKDYFEICGWFKKRKYPIPNKHFLSDTGFIVPGFAAGFLYLTNSSVAYIDCYISNPEATRAERLEALDAITQRIIGCAHVNEVKMICASTQMKAIKDRCLRFDFKETGNHMHFARQLNV